MHAGRKPVVMPWFSTPASASCSSLSAAAQLATHQLGVAHQEDQVGVRQAGHVVGHADQQRRGGVAFVDAAGQPACPGVDAAEPEPHVRRLERVGRPVQRGAATGVMAVGMPERTGRHHQRHRRHHRVDVGERPGFQCGACLLLGVDAPRRTPHRRTLRPQGATRALRRSPVLAASSARMAAASAGLPSIQIRLAARSVAHRCRSVSARRREPAQELLGRLAPPEQHQVHRLEFGGRRDARRRGGGREPIGQVEIQQLHRVPGRVEVQLGVGGEVGLQRQQRPAHRGLRCRRRRPRQPLAPARPAPWTGTSRLRWPAAARRTAGAPGAPSACRCCARR